MNPGPSACEADALPLSYTPQLTRGRKSNTEKSQSAGFEPARVTPIDFKSIAVTTWLRLLALETFVAPAPGETSQSARGTEKTVAGGRSREISARQFEECTFREEKRRERRGERREKERETEEKEKKMRSPGVEPGSQAWKACRLPLPHKRWLGIGRSLGFEPSRYMLGNTPARSVVIGHTQKSDESGIRTHALSEQSLNLPP